jgi:hypothetical protein
MLFFSINSSPELTLHLFFCVAGSVLVIIVINFFPIDKLFSQCTWCHMLQRMLGGATIPGAATTVTTITITTITAAAAAAAAAEMHWEERQVRAIGRVLQTVQTQSICLDLPFRA